MIEYFLIRSQALGHLLTPFSLSRRQQQGCNTCSQQEYLGCKTGVRRKKKNFQVALLNRDYWNYSLKVQPKNRGHNYSKVKVLQGGLQYKLFAKWQRYTWNALKQRVVEPHVQKSFCMGKVEKQDFQVAPYLCKTKLSLITEVIRGSTNRKSKDSRAL